ncbi:MAG: peptidoglycan DD-metalloendopeptidase family protein [Gammaproteobacteria bacterium]|nr:peptidoglycan DD-metalloendopeptidase family protein [Gammaproteobacteria bacterium]
MKLALAALAALFAALPAQAFEFQAEPVPGGIALVELPAGGEPRYRGERVLVRREHGRRYAVVGIPLSAKPGTDYLELDGKRLGFAIRDKRYTEQQLTVKPGQVNPSPEDSARIAREQALMAPAWTAWPEGLEASLRFEQPTQGPLSSSFGLRRVFNGEARAPHSGLDIAAPAGQAVHAPADGVVMLTGDFFFNGNSVFLAHGEGVVTLYCHLRDLKVRPGQRVRTGQLLGHVGRTGRATGPHLHWSLSLNNARVDPRLFLVKTAH